MDTISELNLGARFHAYVKSFLDNRTATLRFADLSTETLSLGSKGTPQGSVISPMLFNLAMAGLAEKLGQIHGLEHTIYADDITMRVSKGTPGMVQYILQEAVNTVEEFLIPTGLRCSPTKSELLVRRPTQKGRRPYSTDFDYNQEITVRTNSGHAIPCVDKIRVLGMIVETKDVNASTVQKLITKTNNAIGLIRRIANRHRGLKEHNLVKLIHAFVTCHFAYVAAMLNWSRSERDRLNAQIRKVTKQALGIPTSTSNEKLGHLGMHNTLEEIAEAQQRAQLARLSTTPPGRTILAKLGFAQGNIEKDFADLPRDIRAKITVRPIPRNVHPENNRGRRQARGQFLLNQALANRERSAFVDAAAYAGNKAFAVAMVDGCGSTRHAATVIARKPEQAEQVAIAVALTNDNISHIYSDSIAAIRAFQKGTVCAQALRIVTKKEIKHHVIYWFPAHLGPKIGDVPNLNEAAHEAARALTDRAASPDHSENKDAPTTYNEITKHYYLQRREFSTPHRMLTRAQAVTLRMLQTDTYPTQNRLHHYMPELYDKSYCTNCNTSLNVYHLLWPCSQAHINSEPDKRKFEEAIRSEELAPQLWAVQQVHDAARKLNLPVPSWETPAP